MPALFWAVWMVGLGPWIGAGFAAAEGMVIAWFVRVLLMRETPLENPAVAVRWRPRWIGGLIGAAMGAGMVIQAMVESEQTVATTEIYWLFGTLFALVGGLAFGWTPLEAEPAAPVTPRSLLLRDRRTFALYLWLWTLAVCLVFAAMLVFVVGYVTPLPQAAELTELLLAAGSVLVLVGGFGVVTGMVAAYRQTAWGAFVLTRLWYALLGRTPLRLLAFLEDAHQRGVFRQVGGSYTFRHAELERHLAE